MKVALVSAYDFAHPGGVANHILFLHKELLKIGHEAKIIAPYSRPRDSIKDKNIIAIGKPIPISSAGSIARITLSPMLSAAVQEVLDREKFDIIHLHEPLYSTLTLTVLNRSKAINIGTFHAFQKTRIPYHLVTPFFNGAVARLHGRIAVSEPARKFINGYFPAEYQIIPNGIDFKSFSTELPPVKGLRNGKLNILFVGRAEKRKGLNYLLQAYRKIKLEFPQTQLIVVGPGNRQKYEPTIKRMKLSDVIFTDYVPNEALPAYYQTADVFCAPATGGESFGIILLEAMAASRPIVASAIEGYSSLMSHGAEGLMVPPKDVDALAKALLELLKDESGRREMGLRGRHKSENYSWPNVAKTVNEYYLNVYNKFNKTGRYN